MMLPAHRDYSTAAAIMALGGIGILLSSPDKCSLVSNLAWGMIIVGMLIALLQVLEQIVIDEHDDEYYCWRHNCFHKLEGGTQDEDD